MMTWAMTSALSLSPRICRSKAQEYHDKLIEAVAETDEELMMKYLEAKS